MVWSDLARDKQCEIVYLFSSGKDVDEIGKLYNLKSTSIVRKMWTLKKIKCFDQMKEKGCNIIDAQSKITQSLPSGNLSKSQTFLDMLQRRRMSSNPITDKTIFIKNPNAVINDRICFLENQSWSIIYFTDLHCPYEDNDTINAALRVIKTIDHNLIINGGDNLDLYGLSSFAKDNNDLFKNNFKREISAHDVIMEKIAATSSVPKLSLYGNHMHRYDKWLSNTPFVDIDSITDLKLEHILRMNYYGWFPFVGSIVIGDKNDDSFPKPILIFEHGTNASAGAGKSSLGKLKDYNATSYVMGHVHRLSVAYKRTLHGQHCTAEGGTMRGLNPDYVKYPDWQNGMLHINVDNGIVSITPILIFGKNAYIGNLKI